MKFSMNYCYLPGLLVCLLLTSLKTAQADTVQTELVRLIAIYGPAVEETLESLPEVRQQMNGSTSSLTAIQRVLRKEPEAKKAAFLKKLEVALDTRVFLEKEASKLPNGLYELAEAMPKLTKVADKALEEAGMPPTSKRTAYDAASNMSSYQAAHMLNCVAFRMADASPAEREQMKAQIKEIAAKNR